MGNMSRLIWAILLGVLLCDLILRASGDPDPKKRKYRYIRKNPVYRRYRRPVYHPRPHPHCPKPKPVPCKPSPCKPVPCKPSPCVPCNKPTSGPCVEPKPSADRHWANTYDESFTFECKGKNSIENIYSLFSSCHHDRIWSFKCGYNKAAIPQSSYWSQTNSFGHPVHFTCPNHGFITGVKSHQQQDHTKDRKFSFKCSNHKDYQRKDCTTSHEVNDFTEVVDYDTNRDKGHYLAGVYSYYNTKTGDRRWKFTVCKLRYSKSSNQAYEDDDSKGTESVKN